MKSQCPYCFPASAMLRSLCVDGSPCLTSIKLLHYTGETQNPPKHMDHALLYGVPEMEVLSCSIFLAELGADCCSWGGCWREAFHALCCVSESCRLPAAQAVPPLSVLQQPRAPSRTWTSQQSALGAKAWTKFLGSCCCGTLKRWNSRYLLSFFPFLVCLPRMSSFCFDVEEPSS